MGNQVKGTRQLYSAWHSKVFPRSSVRLGPWLCQRWGRCWTVGVRGGSNMNGEFCGLAWSIKHLSVLSLLQRALGGVMALASS